MAVWSMKDIGLAVIYSYVIITIINYVLHAAFPSIQIVKTGIAILIFFVGIIVSSIFVFARDGRFDKEDVTGLLVVTAVVIGLYFGIRWGLPDLFSTIAPQKLQEVFSILG